jgi:hypothetical protein
MDSQSETPRRKKKIVRSLQHEEENRFIKFFRTIHKRHEALKNYIHNGFRYPLPKWGQYMMGGVYFTIPLIGGYYTYCQMDKNVENNYGKNYEKLYAYKEKHGLEGIGNIRVSDGKKIGLDGWGGGTALVNSDPITDQRNEQKIRLYLQNLHYQKYGTTQPAASSSETTSSNVTSTIDTTGSTSSSSSSSSSSSNSNTK